MKTIHSILFALSTVAISTAQTTGVPGFNDYTINGGGSGSTSCTAVSVPGGGLFTYTVDTAPNVPTVFFFTPFCGCSPCFFALPPSSPCPIPFTACPTATGVVASNQSLDLVVSPNCLLLSAVATSDAAGQATISFALPSGFLVGTQAASLHPCATGFPALFTQSYTIST